MCYRKKHEKAYKKYKMSSLAKIRSNILYICFLEVQLKDNNFSLFRLTCSQSAFVPNLTLVCHVPTLRLTLISHLSDLSSHNLTLVPSDLSSHNQYSYMSGN